MASFVCYCWLPRSMLWRLAILCLLAWWNSSSPVDGQDTDDCKMSFLPYKNDCVLTIKFKGELPLWIEQKDLALELLTADYEDLKTFATEQVCECRTLSLSEDCPENLIMGVERLVQTCPRPIRNVSLTH